LWQKALRILSGPNLLRPSVCRDLVALWRAHLDGRLASSNQPSASAAALPHCALLYPEPLRWYVGKKVKVHDEAYSRVRLMLPEVARSLTPILGEPGADGAAGWQVSCWILVLLCALQLNPCYFFLLANTSEARLHPIDRAVGVVTFQTVFSDPAAATAGWMPWRLVEQLYSWAAHAADMSREKLFTSRPGRHGMGVLPLNNVMMEMLKQPPGATDLASVAAFHNWVAAGRHVGLLHVRAEKLGDAAVDLGLLKGSGPGGPGYVDNPVAVSMRQGHCQLMRRELAKSGPSPS